VVVNNGARRHVPSSRTSRSLRAKASGWPAYPDSPPTNRVVTDLPAAPATVVTTAAKTTAVTPVAKTNGLAIASLACGLAQFAFEPLATIPAIVCDHMARSQIKRTGEQGAGLALAGLTLGRTAVILGILFIVLGLAISIRMHGTMPMH
jgi:hypothetical protein